MSSKNTPNEFRFAEIKKIPRTSESNFEQQVSEKQESLNREWAKSLISPNPNAFIISPTTPETIPDPSPLYTLASPNEEENEIPKIDQAIMANYERKFESINDNSFHEIEHQNIQKIFLPFSNSEIESPDIDIQQPDNIFQADFYLHVNFTEFSLEEERKDNVLGYFNLYTISDFCPLFEPVFFKISQNRPIFLLTNNSDLYFPIHKNQISQDIVLTCILFQKDEEICSPFAASYVPLFDDSLHFISPTKFSPIFMRSTDLINPSRSKKQITDPSFKGIAIKSAFISNLNPQPIPFSYTFTPSLLGKYPLLSSEINQPSYYSTPLIKISRISFEIAHISKQYTHLYFQLFLVDEPTSFTSSSGIDCLVSNGVNVTRNSFRSFVIPEPTTSTNQGHALISFPDVVIMHIDQAAKPGTHIMISLYASKLSSENKNIDQKLIKVGVIPLMRDGYLPSDLLRFPLYDPSDLPPDYISIAGVLSRSPISGAKNQSPLKTKFKEEKVTGWVEASVNIPPEYFPPPQMMLLVGAQDEEHIPELDWSEMSQNSPYLMTNNLIPIINKFLKYPTPLNIQRLLLFFQAMREIDPDKEYQEVIISYVHHVMKTDEINPNFINTVCSSFTKALRTLNSMKTVPNVSNDIGDAISPDEMKALVQQRKLKVRGGASACICSILHMVLIAAYDQPDFDSQILIDFLRYASAIILKQCADDEETNNNDDFAKIICLLIPLLDADEVKMILNQHLSGLRQLLQYCNFFSFLSILIFNSNFISELKKDISFGPNYDSNYSPYHPILSTILSTTILVFEAGPDISEEERQYAVDNAALFYSKLAVVIDNSKEDKDKLSFMFFPAVWIISAHFNEIENDENKMNLIIFVLTEMRAIGTIRLQQFFTSLGGNDSQCSFISFLFKASKFVIKSVEKDNPTFDNPKYSLCLFNQMTKVLISFMYSILEFVGKSKSKPNFLKEIISLINVLLSKFQPLENIDNFNILLRQTIKQFDYPQKTLIFMLMKLIMCKLTTLSSFATSILDAYILHITSIHNQSSFFFIKAFICEFITLKYLKEFDIKKEQVFTTLCDSLTFFADKRGDSLTKSNISSLSTNISQIFKLLQTIINDSNVSPEDKASLLMKEADQWKNYPPLRCLFLSEIVNVNKADKDTVSTFISQLHVYEAIFACKFGLKPKSKQKLINMSFVKEVTEELDIDFKFLEENGQPPNELFSDAQLNDALKQSLSYAIEAEMGPVLIPFISEIWRYTNENLAMSWKKLSQSLSASSMSLQDVLSFFYHPTSKSIFCFSTKLIQNSPPNPDEFIPLIPFSEVNSSLYSSHSFDAFTTQTDWNLIETSGNKFSYKVYRLKVGLPHYRKCALVTKEEEKTVEVKQFILKELEKRTLELERARRCVEIWVDRGEEKKTPLNDMIKKEFVKLQSLIIESILEFQKIKELSFYKENCALIPELKMVNQKKEISKDMKLYLLCKGPTNTNNEELENLVSDFTQENLEEKEKDAQKALERRSDPMKFKFYFEH